MAKARPVQKKKRIIITRRQEDKGDLQISGGEARLRLTPRLFLTMALIVTAAVSIVVVAVRYSGRHYTISTPEAVPFGERTEQMPQPAAANRAPEVRNAGIIPEKPDASSPLDIKYETTDRDGDPVSCTFRWFVNDSQVQEGDSSILQPSSYRSGDVVFAEVIPADSKSTGAPFKTQPVTIGASAPTVTGVTLVPGTASIGDVLTATPAGDGKAGAVSYRYQWYVNGDAVGSPGSENTFDTRNLKKRDSVFVAVSATDGSLTSGAIRSNMVFLQNRNPEITSSAPESLQGVSYSYKVVAKDPDGDVLKYRLERAPAGMTINESSGLIQWTLKKDTMYAGRNEAAVRVTVDDGDGGTASQDFTIVFTDLYVQ